MVDLLVELDDRTIHALLLRAKSAGRSLNDEMLSILKAAAADEDHVSPEEDIRLADEFRRKYEGQTIGDNADPVPEDPDLSLGG